MFDKRKQAKTREAMDKAFNSFRDAFSDGDMIADVLYSTLDKSFYDNADETPERWLFPGVQRRTNMVWQQFVNLPTGVIGKEDMYHSNERMQNLLCSEHAMKHTTAFLLLRQDRYTGLYLGAASRTGGSQIQRQIRENVQLNLPGARMKSVTTAKRGTKEYFDTIESKLSELKYCGVITGQPSLRRNETENPVQTLDRLTSGILNYEENIERDYAMMAISEPIPDIEVKGLIQKMQALKSALHEYASYHESMSNGESVSQNRSRSFSGSIGTLLFTALGSVAGFSVGGVGGAVAGGQLAGDFLSTVGKYLGFSTNRTRSFGESATLTNTASKEHVNFMVRYCEELLDKAIKRMEKGRNLGFWNTTIYVLGDSLQTVDLVAAELRSVYSGEETYQEPIRIFNFGQNSEVRKFADSLQLLPMPIESQDADLARTSREIAADASADGESWHIFGKIYELMATPMTTEELSIVMSLPKKDVPGIHIKKDAVEFSTNPPSQPFKAREHTFGEILDMGSVTGHLYNLDIDQLNRHGLIVGLNGGGKSVTSKSILRGVMKHDIPFMVIDPAKTDYAFWADAYNKAHRNDSGFKPIRIYAPGMSSIHGIQTPISTLKMNPFKPYACVGAPLNMQGHISSLLGLLNKTMAMGDFLPMLLEEAVVEYLELETMIEGITEETELDPNTVQMFPKLSGLVKANGVVDNILKDRNYSTENTQNFKAAIVTRINALTRGWKKNFFEPEICTTPEELFENNVVICLAGVTNNSDKAFLMSLLLQAASEYRLSKYQYDDSYRARVERGRREHGGSYLAHYTVVEEAHRIVQAPKPTASDSDPQAAAAEKFCEMLSEIREPGEGIMIIDQYPSRLVADAVKNTNLKIIHRLQAADDRAAMAGCMSLNENQSRLLSSLKKGDTVICSEQDESAMWLHIIMK